MSIIRTNHWLIRGICVLLGVGAVVGIVMSFLSIGTTGWGASLICVLFSLIYLAIGAAAVGLWFGEELGLQWTRLLLLLQIPLVQSGAFSYVFYVGATGLLYAGGKFGLQGFVGSSFSVAIHAHAASGGGWLIGVNVLAIAMLVVLGRVDLMPAPAPPPLPTTPARVETP